MTPRLLGYAVLLYAVSTSSAGLRLVGLAMGHWDGDWWAISDAGIWLSFVVGGAGLIASQVWARAVLLVAAVASASTGVLAIVFFWNAGFVLASLSNVLTILVSVAILIGLRRLPTSAVPKPQTSFDKTDRAEPLNPAPDKRVVLHRLDLAYACFAWIAVAMWFEKLGKILPIDPDSGQALFMLLWVPILFATLFAAIAAFVVSILEWREFPLVIMMGTSASMLFVSLAVDYVEPYWYVGGTAILVAFCIRWFAFARRRQPAP
jgi:hypothetical protein